MDSAKCSPSPSNISTGIKDTKTSFLTPCRRLGLARKSPASSGSWHANKSSPSIASPTYNSPSQFTTEKSLDAPCNEKDQATPSRNMSRTINKRALSKRFKSSSPLSSHICSEEDENNILVSEKPQCQDTLSENGMVNILAKYGGTSCSDIDLMEVTLPEGEITKELIKEAEYRVKKKEEKLEELKRAHIYKKKHDVNTLQELIQRWLEGCQAALQELQSILHTEGHQLTMEELLRQLNIPCN